MKSKTLSATRFCSPSPATIPAPLESCFLATRMAARRSGPVTTSFVKEIADLFGLRLDDGLASIPDIVDSANQSGRAARFAVADFIAAISAVRPDAEALALGLAEVVLAQKLKSGQNLFQQMG
jgi:hypothetical protein